MSVDLEKIEDHVRTPAEYENWKETSFVININLELRSIPFPTLEIYIFRLD